MTMEQIADVLGVFGVIMLLAAYFFLQYDKLKAHSLLYILANLIGSLLILYSVFYAWNLSAAIIESAWALISLFGIYKWYKMRK